MVRGNEKKQTGLKVVKYCDVYGLNNLFKFMNFFTQLTINEHGEKQ